MKIRMAGHSDDQEVTIIPRHYRVVGYKSEIQVYLEPKLQIRGGIHILFFLFLHRKYVVAAHQKHRGEALLISPTTYILWKVKKKYQCFSVEKSALLAAM